MLFIYDYDMTTKLGISVFIITKNEEDRIATAITSVKDFAKEVIVIDSGSTDETLKIAKNLGAKTFYNPWQGYGKQKRFGEDKCSNKWILNLDADEEVSHELKEEIIMLFKNKEPHLSAYKIKIKMMPRFAKTVHILAPMHFPIRLYDKTKCRYDDNPVHDSVIVDTIQVGELKGHFNHRTFKSHAHMVDKINFYSSMQALELYKKGRKVNKLRLVFEPSIAFLKAYLVQRYFVWGFAGFELAVIYAFSRFIRLAKLREIYNEKEYIK